MPLEIGSTLGVYEVTAAIGAGGMGEVYKARDTKLDRDVALKILPDAFVNDAERLARFQREAKVLASLNHPNIAAIHGLEESGGSPALVLEYVEGPTLQDRIANGPIPLDEALPIARQIAEALEAAHEQGIIHRDLKPANVKVKDDGTVKVLDFGLAKALEPEQTEAEAANSPTMTMTAAATRAGFIMGTAAYMSPEQARGNTADRRSDIWAFGVVLLEMLTGASTFAGKTLSDTLAAVLRQEMDWNDLPPQTPASVRRLLRRCLEKEPKQRLSSIGDARLDIEDAKAEPGTPAATAGAPPALWQRPVSVAAIALGALVLGGLGVWTLVQPEAEPIDVTRFEVSAPGPGLTSLIRDVELSPDGRHLVLAAGGRLWVRSLDSVEPTLLDGTEGATYPFWSPDNATVGFFAGGALRTIDRTGGLIQTVAEAVEGRGATWSPNGTIVFSPNAGEGGLFATPAAGGDIRRVTTIPEGSGADGHRYPHFLPDGERFVYLFLTGDAELQGAYVGSLDGAPPMRVNDRLEETIYAAPAGDAEPGYLLFRQGADLNALQFDPASLQATGAPFRIVAGVGQGPNTGSSVFSVSADGDLAYSVLGWSTVRLAWFDRTGQRQSDMSDLAGVYAFALSPDERQTAISAVDEVERNTDVWLQPDSRGTPTKFTFGPQWTFPAWAPDGRAVAYATMNLAGLPNYEIRRRASNLADVEETLFESDASQVYLWDWAPDGSYLVYELLGDLWLLPLDTDGTPEFFLETPARESYAQISPDGRWMAYTSDAAGRQEVYVRSIPPTESFWQVSTGGGSMPRWRRDGRELFYRAADGTLMAIEVGENRGGEGATAFEYVPTPTPLFGGVPADDNSPRWVYQPSADGERFAMITLAVDADLPVTVVQNWIDELQARIPTP